MSFLTLEKLVQTLPSLTSLNVLGCEFKSEEVKHAVPGSCAKVQSLVIGGKTLLDDMFSGILKVFSGVTDLDMSGCTKVSGKVVLTTLDGLSSLKVLNATGKHNHIDKQVFTKLKETHPSLVIYTTKKLN